MFIIRITTNNKLNVHLQIRVIMPELKIQEKQEDKWNERPEFPEVGSRLNGDNNLEWTIQLGQNEKKLLIIKWEAEYPSNQDVEYAEAR